MDDILQTQDGFLWLRENGVELGRFDGQHFASSSKLESITALAVAPNGDLWVGASDDLKRIPADELSQLDHWHPESHPLGHGLEIVALHFTEEGVLCTNRGLYRFENGVFLGVRAADIFDIMEDSKGVTWFCTKDGVARRVGGTLEKLKPYGPRESVTFAVYEDPRGAYGSAGMKGCFN